MIATRHYIPLKHLRAVLRLGQLERYAALRIRMLNLSELAFVAGPEDLPAPAFSFADDWKTPIFTPDEFAAAVLSIDGARLIRDCDPDWDTWRVRWQCGDRFIEFEILACDLDPTNDDRPGLTDYWGGSPFTAHCDREDLLTVWIKIRQRLPGVCVHDTDCRMYSPDTFRDYKPLS